MRHGDIWRGLDELAARHGLSTSGLAKRAGLDATAFNKSKRTAKDGRPRWPSTESLSMALAAVNSDLVEFASILTGPSGMALPTVRLDQILAGEALDSDGDLVLPAAGSGDVTDEVWQSGAFIIEVTSTGFAPAYHAGDRLIVSPNSELRVDDRAMLKTRSGDYLIAKRQTAQMPGEEMEWQCLSGDPVRLPASSIVWASRILWLGQ